MTRKSRTDDRTGPETDAAPARRTGLNALLGGRLNIPGWQRGRDTGASSASDYDTEQGIVVPDHLDTPARSGHASGFAGSQGNARTSRPAGQPASRLPPRNNDEDADGFDEMPARPGPTRLVMVIGGLLLMGAAGLGWSAHQRAGRVEDGRLAVDTVSAESGAFVREVLLARGPLQDPPRGATLAARLATATSAAAPLALVPDAAGAWTRFVDLARPVAGSFDDYAAYRQKAAIVSGRLTDAWTVARGQWSTAGQSGLWNTQPALGDAIGGVGAWAALATAPAAARNLDPAAGPLEKAVTTALQATSGLNADTGILGQTWKGLAQVWIAQRPAMLELVSGAGDQQSRLVAMDALLAEAAVLDTALHGATSALDAADHSASTTTTLAMVLAFAGLGTLGFAIWLQVRHTRREVAGSRQAMAAADQHLQQMKDTLQAVGNGQGHLRLPVRPGVIGDISHQVNQVLDAAGQLVMSQNRQWREISARLEALQTQSGEMADHSQVLFEALALSGEALLELEDSSSILDRQSASTDQLLIQVRDAGQEGGEAVRGVGRNMADLQARVQEVFRGTENLMETSRQIGGCIEGLSHLADQAEVLSIQTDLRAVQMENGEPFRLAAREMHSIAEQNNVLVRRVAGFVESILREAQVVVDATGRATSTTDAAARLGDLTEEAWGRLNDASLRMAALVEQIHAAAGTQTGAIAHLSEQTQAGLGVAQDLVQKAPRAQGALNEVIGLCQVAREEVTPPRQTS